MVHPRRPLEQIIHHEKYNTGKARTDADVKSFIAEMSIRGTQYHW
jgi:hypothetical protein